MYVYGIIINKESIKGGGICCSVMLTTMIDLVSRRAEEMRDCVSG